MIEFAISAVVLFTCIFGIIGCSQLLYAYHFTSYAAREATRYAMVRGSTWGSASCASTTTSVCSATNANVQAYVQSIVPPGMNSGTPLTVTTTWPGTELAGSATTCTTTNGNNSPGCLVMVQVNYSFSYLLPFLPTTALNLKSSSEVVILQ
jgi:Flp pilus assembly protein TadG